MGSMSARLFKGGGANLRADFYFHVPYEHYGLPAFLGLKVQQKTKAGTAPSFLPFEAVFPFNNNLRTVVGKQDLYIEKTTLSFYKERAVEEKSLLDSYQLVGAWLKGKELGFRKAGWEVQLKRLRFSDVDLETCPTLVGRVIRYVGEVCIVDPLTGEAVSDTSISIQRQNIEVKSDGSFEEKSAITLTEAKDLNPTGSGQVLPFVQGATLEDSPTSRVDQGSMPISSFQEGTQRDLSGNKIDKSVSISDTSGCLRWVDKLSHKWYNKEKYFIRRMIFSKKEWGFSGEKMIAINPWHWGFVFFQDISQLGHSAIRTNPQKAEPPRVILHDFRSLFPNLIYTIDRWLGINLFQNLLFLFRIRIDRPDNVSVGLGGQRPSAQEARRGYYTVRFMLVKSHTEEAGGKGNQVVNDHTYRQQKIEDGNHNQGWNLGRRNGRRTGQMMNTNLEYITHYDTYVQVRDSMVNAYANFLFDLNEFVFIGSNNRLIVQLWPTDPQYYVYKPNSCEIDPLKSQFKPFFDHDLVTPAFMGTFVPGDQRNWNIFRALSDSISLKKSSDLDVLSLDMDPVQTENFVENGDINIPNLGSENQVVSLNNISPHQWDRFIKSSKKRGEEHKLWTKLGTHWTVRANSFSEEARPLIREMGAYFSALQFAMESFLRLKPNNQPLSKFQQAKNRLLESVDQAMTWTATVLKGADTSSADYAFFQDIRKIMSNSLNILKDSNKEPLTLQAEMDIIRRSFVSLTNSALQEGKGKGATFAGSPSYQKDLQHENPNQTSIDLRNSRHFKPEIEFPEEPAKWSAFNMYLFAKDRGLKVITQEDPLMDTFIEDLNISANIHNFYHNQYKELADTEHGRLVQSRKQEEELNQTDRKPVSFEKGKGAADEVLSTSGVDMKPENSSKTSIFWNNFELMEGDNYHTMKKKLQQMYLPAMDEEALHKVLENGIHTGNLHNWEVMTFLHSLCGFWFNHFYSEYLEQEQLDILFENHMDHFRYYKGTLDYLSNAQGSYQQYQDLYEAMEKYNLTPMQESFLNTQNPFAWHKKERLSLGPLLVRGNNTAVSNTSPFLTSTLHDSLNEIGAKAWLQTGSIDTTTPQISLNPWSVVSSSLLQNHRHPYFKCIANPLNFFHTEKKIIVGDIGSDYSDLKYEYGLTFSYNLQKAFDYAYSTQWSMSRSFSASLGTGFTALGGLDKLGGALNPLKIVNPFIEFNGVKLSGDWGTSRSDADSNRRQHSLRFSDESMYFQVNKSVISIRLKNFRHCLVVRAKNQAFEGYHSDTIKVWKEELENNFVQRIPYIKSGLLLCSKDISDKELSAPFEIKEDYYYLYQLMPMDRGQFQNPLSFRNRPYIMSVRGRTEMEKLSFLLHSFVEGDKKEGVEDYNPYVFMTNPYNTSPRVAEGTREMIQQAKVWDKTGFYPGVYDVNYDQEHYFLRDRTRINNMSPEEDKKKWGLLERLGDWLYRKNPWGYMRFDGTLSTPKRSEP